jgi:hypothetical protein
MTVENTIRRWKEARRKGLDSEAKMYEKHMAKGRKYQNNPLMGALKVKDKTEELQTKRKKDGKKPKR